MGCAPHTTVTSSFAGLEYADAIATDAPGNIYVANELGGPGNYGSVNVYAAGGYATTMPIATIAGNNTGLWAPQAIAADSLGDIAVSNFGAGAITQYPAGTNGNVAPSPTLDGLTGAIAFDPAGNLLAQLKAARTAANIDVISPATATSKFLRRQERRGESRQDHQRRAHGFGDQFRDHDRS